MRVRFSIVPRIVGSISAAAFVLLPGPVAAKPLTKCAPDAIVSGTVCIDKYEASVWRVPQSTTANKSLVKKVQQGKAKIGDLAKGGATELGTTGNDYAPCAINGQNCTDDIYAVSLAGVTPSAYLTWLQALAACENSRKRLPSNAEWQAAVAGTPNAGPDDGVTDCNTGSVLVAVTTGSRSRCVSARGAFDMVGNLFEWVAEWVPRSTSCGIWSAELNPTGDINCLAGAASDGEPGALLRGGYFDNNAYAGPLAIDGFDTPSFGFNHLGFRCAR